MNTRKLSLVVVGLAVLSLAAGVSGATSQMLTAPPAAVAAAVASGISYQGRLTSPTGRPQNGTYTMRFIIYNAGTGGSALWDSGNLSIAVQGGLFNVKLGVDQASFNGQALWLSIIVNGQTLSPRQELLPAAYALSLRPGADIVGDSIAAADAALEVSAPVAGTGLYAAANSGVGVRGSSNNSWGGYFQSAQYEAVRGEAGDITGISQPIGTVGVVGIGQNRGAFGASLIGMGLYGTSDSNYGVWGSSNTYRGVTGRTSRIDNNYGLYTPDNLYSQNINMAGAIMQVMQNGGRAPLSPGDVVIFAGLARSVTGVDGPIVRVSKANLANSTAVAGVVFSRFNIDAIDPTLEFPDDSAPGNKAVTEVTPGGSAPPGEYVLVVVQGPALVKASALARGDIQPGDLLATSSAAGLAGKAALATVNGVAMAVPGTVFGKALEPLSGAQEMIYVYVTLQ